MTERSPLPACLSHLTQRDAAVRARALEEAAQIADRFTCGGCGMDGKTGIAIRAMMQAPTKVTVVRREVPTPPAPAPVQSRGPHNACDGGTCDQPDNCAKEGECHYTKSLFQQGPPAPDEGGMKLGSIGAYVLKAGRSHYVTERPIFTPDEVAIAMKSRMAAAIESKARPPAPAPDEAAIRAELIAALRQAHDVIICTNPWAVETIDKINTALAKVTA